ncbi:hypothetical protein DXC08_02055 [Clostridium sp. OM07-9AC]|nr:hypothetical protein DXC08_02055 [Clostridium sp. OM07-9AC]
MIVIFGDIQDIQSNDAFQSNAVFPDFLFINLDPAGGGADLKNSFLFIIRFDLIRNTDNILCFSRSCSKVTGFFDSVNSQAVE